MLEIKVVLRLYHKYGIRDSYGVQLPQFIYDLLRVTPGSVPQGMSSIESKVLQLVETYTTNKHDNILITS